MRRHLLTGLTCGLVGFVLGGLVSGTVVDAWRHPVIPITPAHAATGPARAGQVRPLPQRIVLRAVQPQDVPAALETMGLDEAGRILVSHDLDARRYRLLWLTLWDWDAQNESDGDTISINSDDYRRAIKLLNRRQQIAVPEPRSGYIELRGEQTGDGIIAISLLSGAQPVALPRIAIGQTTRIEVDAP